MKSTREVVKLANCGHSPHRDQPDTVLDVVRRFIEQRHGADDLR